MTDRQVCVRRMCANRIRNAAGAVHLNSKPKGDSYERLVADAGMALADLLDGPLAKIYNAIKNEGPKPGYHRGVVNRHREEFPKLWEGIEELMTELQAAR